MELFEFLSLQFVQRALIVGLLLSILLPLIGRFVVLNRMSFFADGIAHASLVGIAIGIIMNQNSLVWALIVGIVISIFLYFFEKRTHLSQDVLIGIFFSVSMAIGVILLSTQGTYQPDLVSFLFGNILSIRASDLIIIAPLSIFAIILLLVYQKRILASILDPIGARLFGINREFFSLLLYILLSVVTIVGVKLLGIILVSALLLLPLSASQFISRSFLSYSITGVIIAFFSISIGLIASFYLDFPSGATIVLVSFGLFIVFFISSKITRLMRN